jgi:AraC-type DNA-binding domain-containing proteins
MLEVIHPSALLAPYVKQYWFLRLENVELNSQRFLPNGSTMLTFQREEYHSYIENGLLQDSSLSGQYNSPVNMIYSGTIDLISIVFQPIGAKIFFQIPMNELNNRNIPIEMLCDSQIMELEKSLKETTNKEICIRLIENFLLKRICQFENPNHNRLNAIIDSIQQGQYDISILAQTACLGYKQFKRLFAEHIGINPKDFIRVTRFQKAIHILQTQPQITLTNLSDNCGYYDKSHFIKELKEYSGYSPKAFLNLCDPYSDYYSLFRSTFLDTKYS